MFFQKLSDSEAETHSRPRFVARKAPEVPDESTLATSSLICGTMKPRPCSTHRSRMHFSAVVGTNFRDFLHDRRHWCLHNLVHKLFSACEAHRFQDVLHDQAHSNVHNLVNKLLYDVLLNLCRETWRTGTIVTGSCEMIRTTSGEKRILSRFAPSSGEGSPPSTFCEEAVVTSTVSSWRTHTSTTS